MNPPASQPNNGYRLGRVERAVEGHDEKISELTVIAARAEERMGRMAEDVQNCRRELTALRQNWQERTKEETQQRRTDRRWWVGIGISIFMAIIGAAGIVAGAL